MALQSLLEFFRPFPIFGILAISFLVTLLVTLVYKWTTKQDELKRLKKEQKKYQQQVKELSKTDPKKAMAVQKKMMELSFQLMKQSFRPTLYTFIPLIIFFGWLSSHMAYLEIAPGQEFVITAEFDKYLKGNASITSVPSLEFIGSTEQEISEGRASWQAKGDEGYYTITITEDNHEYNKKILVSTAWTYVQPEEKYKGTSVKKIIIGNEKVRPFGQWFNIFGYYPGWLITYILSSVVFSTLLRRFMQLA
ncbi:MAG: EMC3/TMCO1 family protein [Nanoarchaeota archaeon]